MLHGSILYYKNGDNPKCEIDNAVGSSVQEADGIRDYYRYSFIGTDNSSFFTGSLETSVYEAICEMAGDDEEVNQISSRRFDCSMAGVKVTTVIGKDENGKKVKYGVNYDLFIRLGAIIRYCKNLCRQENATDFIGLGNASGEYSPEAETEYSIPQYMGSKTKLGTITLKLGEIHSAHIESPYFSIHIDDVSDAFQMLDKIKDSLTKGFSFDVDTLGFFKPKEVVLPSTVSGLITDLDEICRRHPDKDFSWLYNKNYQIVTDDNLEEICDKFMSVPDDDFIFYDTETSGLNINFKSRTGDADQLVGVVLSHEDGVSYFFPTQMKTMPNLCGGDHFYFMNKYMRPILEGKKLVAHNLSFDWKVAYIYGINANIVHDTMAMLLLTFCEEKPSFPSDLKGSSKLLLGRDSLELDYFSDTGKWSSSNTFWDLPPEIVRLYACADTDNTRGICWYIIKNNILQRYNAERIYEIEVRFSYAVAYQEFYGHHINTETVSSLRSELDADIEASKKRMVEMVGHDFNPNSAPQLKNILYTEMGAPEQTDFKTGNLSTSKDSLKKLQDITDENGDLKYPFVDELLHFRNDEGVRKIVAQFPKYATPDGFLFSSVYQYGTTTGRVSIHEPNYQSYNDRVKQRVVPRDGYYMTDTDYSSVEYRVLGSMVGNKMIMDGFVDPDFDYHAYQAARMFNVPYSAVTKTMRKHAKGINFGLPYGMGDSSLGARIFGERTAETKLKAKAMREKYFTGQEDILNWFENTRDKGEFNGYTETYFGRRRYYDKTKQNSASIRRQAGNAVIQGSAADIYKLAVGRLFLRICKEGWLGKVLLTGFIHDEVLCEVHNSIDPMVWLKVLREEFEVKIDGWCPLYMGFGFGMSWKEAKLVELPIQLQWELVEKYGETGYPKWTGDGYALCAEVPSMLRDFYIRHIYNTISKESAQGKEINVAINKTLFEIYGDDASIYNKIYNECNGDADAMLIKLRENHIDKVVYNEDDSVASVLPYSEVVGGKDGSKTKIAIIKGTTSNQLIDIFCDIHSFDRTCVNVLEIDTTVESSTLDTAADNTSAVDEVFDDTLISAKAQADARIVSLGMYCDIEEKTITLRMLNAEFMAFIRARAVSKEVADTSGSLAYNIKLKDINSGTLYDTELYLLSSDIGTVQDLYIQYFKMTQGRTTAV